MNIETVPFNTLVPSKANPRKAIDAKALEGLAASIRTDGILQNLIVTPMNGKGGRFAIVSGERRYRALELLVKRGEKPEDHPVPVVVRSDLGKDEKLRIATIENMQREDLTPLEEAEAINALVQDGGTLDDIVAKTGLSENTVKRRLALLNLSNAVKEALGQGRVTLAQAEALSLGSHDEQEGLLDDVAEGYYGDPGDIRERLIGELPTLAMAIFPKEQYTGGFTTDLFAEDQSTYFDDAGQFFELQEAAAEKLAADFEGKRDWAELVEGRFQSWQYRQAKKGESGGVVVCLTPEGKVEVHEGLIRGKIDPSVSDAARPRPKAAYAKPLREYIAMHKSAAVQVELIGNPRKAKEVGVAAMLYRGSTHACLGYLADHKEQAVQLEAVNGEAAALAALIGTEHEDASFRVLLGCAYSKAKAYEMVQSLSDQELDRLFVFLSAIAFGQENCGELDTNADSLFNRVATDLGVDMRKYWMPDLWFLSRRSMDQLGKIIVECGLTRLYGNGKGFKKGDLVPMMVRYFRKVRDMKKPKADQVRARDWLPEIMAFPAIDPDARPDSADEDATGE